MSDSGALCAFLFRMPEACSPNYDCDWPAFGAEKGKITAAWQGDKTKQARHSPLAAEQPDFCPLIFCTPFARAGRHRRELIARVECLALHACRNNES